MATLEVEVVYALPAQCESIKVRVPAGATVADALKVCGILERRPEIHLSHAEFGIFARRVDAATVLAQGDRVEIYRPLRVDPKEARRRRAARKR